MLTIQKQRCVLNENYRVIYLNVNKSDIHRINDQIKRVPTVFCCQVKLKAFIDQITVLCLPFVFIVEIIVALKISHTMCLFAHLSLLPVVLDSLGKQQNDNPKI